MVLEDYDYQILVLYLNTKQFHSVTCKEQSRQLERFLNHLLTKKLKLISLASFNTKCTFGLTFKVFMFEKKC